MSKDKIDETTKKNKKGKLRERFLKVVLLVLIIFLINLYIILRILYEGDNFTVTLDSEFGKESNLKIYENLDKKLERTFLRSEDIDFLSDISINWIPADIHNQGEGSHNGPHFIAYTFYVENEGKETINYWKMIEIDNVARDVDKAIRRNNTI